MEASERSTVLVVVPDSKERGRWGGWLEGAGMEVLECPGSSSADGCIGIREGSCQLTKAADVVLLDQRAGRERELESHYLVSGKPVVVLGSTGEHLLPFGRQYVMRLPQPPKEASLVNAVRYQLRAGGPAGRP
jgi:hypothetical protein